IVEAAERALPDAAPVNAGNDVAETVIDDDSAVDAGTLDDTAQVADRRYTGQSAAPCLGLVADAPIPVTKMGRGGLEVLKKAKLETAGSAAPKKKGQAKGRELNKSFKKKGRKCNTRARLACGSLAFTPFWGHHAAGQDPDYCEFLRSAYCFGLKMPNDATCFFVKHEEETFGAVERRAGGLFHKHKLVMAFTEAMVAEQMLFENEVVEGDTARFGSNTLDTDSGRLQVHEGRTLVLKGRRSKRWSATGLAPTASSRAMPPETVADVKPQMDQQLGSGVVFAPDGARAWLAATRESDVPVLTGVNHNKKVFTPVSTLAKKDLSASATKTLKRQTGAQKGLARETKHAFEVVGGDNMAESLLGHIKQSMRRSGAVRGGTAGSKKKTAQVLSAAALLRGPGLLKLLSGYKAYRGLLYRKSSCRPARRVVDGTRDVVAAGAAAIEACSTGTVPVGPRDAWSMERAMWLQQEPQP
ncbi:unnamed protein product, partial [Symbiodinium necroappetens]